MKAELKRDGYIHLFPESEIELYALNKWNEEQNFIIENIEQKLENRQFPTLKP